MGDPRLLPPVEHEGAGVAVALGQHQHEVAYRHHEGPAVAAGVVGGEQRHPARPEVSATLDAWQLRVAYFGQTAQNTIFNINYK